MAYKYFPQTEEDIREMLAKIGAGWMTSMRKCPTKYAIKANTDCPTQ